MTRIKFWGVRGSIPTPGPSTVRYGGNTSCVEIRHEDQLIILDGGSGIRLLGQQLLKSSAALKASIFISHMHWDHIQGIPFFTPAFIPTNKFTFYGAEEADKNLQTIIADQMNPTYFPIELSDMASQLDFIRLYEGNYAIDGYDLTTMYVNHPGNALGFNFRFGAKKLVYISDNEPFGEPAGSDSQPGQIGEDGTLKLIDFIKEADILIHDSQYTAEEYETHKTWGHSPVDYTVSIANKAGVKRLILYHHDPQHDDDFVDRMLGHARQLARPGLDVIAAAEGLQVEL